LSARPRSASGPGPAKTWVLPQPPATGDGDTWACVEAEAAADGVGGIVGESALVDVGAALGTNEGNGAAHPTSRAQSRAIANGLIGSQTVCVPRWLRKSHRRSVPPSTCDTARYAEYRRPDRPNNSGFVWDLADLELAANVGDIEDELSSVTGSGNDASDKDSSRRRAGGGRDQALGRHAADTEPLNLGLAATEGRGHHGNQLIAQVPRKGSQIAGDGRIEGGRRASRRLGHGTRIDVQLDDRRKVAAALVVDLKGAARGG